ncbi:MAG: nicotinate-nucleotide adenylyltransferase [Fimbriimonadaceae bacterium]
MKIGVLGGTFDPPHLGHLQLAQAAVTHLDLDEVMLMIARRNPMKATIPGASAKQRLEMVRLAIEDHPKVSICDLELQRDGPSYAYESMEQLEFVKPAEYWFVLGSDAARTLPQWKKVERLLRSARIAMAVRPPDTQAAALAALPPEMRERIDPIAMPESHISSTDIRHRIAEGKSVSAFLDPKVLQYIKKHRLYTTA